MDKKKAIIIGAGPAGLTAAYELLEKTDIIPIIYEESSYIGGISRTADYKGNKIDIGGHRFFSKSELIINWWKNIMEMPARKRISRIYFLNRFFDYPVSLNKNTICNLGLARIVKIGLSYLKIKLFPIKKEKNLEDFFINRFGRELYETFFKDYTEKVWGVACRDISASWGAQRVKGLSVMKALRHFFKKTGETSLIDTFMYPEQGPGQMWEAVAAKISKKGGKIFLNHKITGLKIKDNNVIEFTAEKTLTKEKLDDNAEYYFSSMPVRELVESLDCIVSEGVKQVSDGLLYRDFVTVGVLLKKLKLSIPDNWIYVQEKSVKMGRIQFFNNWSPEMVSNPANIWIGLEYFCNEGDDLWSKTDEEFKEFAVEELEKINIIDKKDVLDSVIIRQKKAYPAYFGSYDRFDEVKNFLNTIENLYLIGRNGMHRYNNMDHSMLSAITAVENIINNVKSRENIWDINTEEVYHEKINK